MGGNPYRGLDEKVFSEAFYESGGDAFKASKSRNFEYSHKTYTAMWRRLALIENDKEKIRADRKAKRQRYLLADSPEVFGKP